MKFNRPYKRSTAKKRRPSWRSYQVQLKRQGRGRINRRFIWTCAGVLSAVLIVWGVASRTADTTPHPAATDPPVKAVVEKTTGPLLSKTDVKDMLADRPVSDLLRKHLSIRWGDQELTVHSSIDKALQHYLGKRLYEKTSRYIAIVVMEGATGRILAMVGYDRTDPDGNPCLNSQFPAASIFKIVTAGAAMETCNLSSQSSLSYNGAKHTLYKSQLKKIQNRYTHQTTLAKSFAQSINPVFGKLGSHCLGRKALAQYADAFGFNRPIPFELPVSPSRAPVSADPYQWAEMASGFNRDTLLSPLHGALLAAIAPNGGLLVEPTIVDRIADPRGQELYRPGTTLEKRAVTAQTAREMERLMRETVRRGTARKIFRSQAKDRVLSRLVIGGKTGSIDNAAHDARFDWFVGFARHSQNRETIVVSAVVAHEKYIGRRAGEYARLAMKEYFRSRGVGGRKSS